MEASNRYVKQMVKLVPLSSEQSAIMEEEVSFLELENSFLSSLLQRVAPGSVGLPAPAAPANRSGPTLLLLPEKQELCVAEAAAIRRQIEKIKADWDLERACIEAGIGDARKQQAAETARDLAALLGLLGLPAPPAAAAAEALGMAVVAAATAVPLELGRPGTPTAAASAGGAASPAAAEVPPPAAGAESVVPATAAAAVAAAAAALALPSARQLTGADLNGARLAHFLEDVLARHAAATTRLQTRNAMLQGQLNRVEAALGQRAELGAALRKVDFDALRIEHSQAEAALAAASADAVALKAQVASAAQRLAEQRAALASAATASGVVARQTGVREGQAAVLRAEVAKARRECAALERECRQLRAKRGLTAGGCAAGEQQQGSCNAGEGHDSCRMDTDHGDAGVGSDAGGADGSIGDASSSGGADGSPATILEYMQVKNALAETAKRISDWKRKLEVQAGRLGRAGATAAVAHV